MAHTHFWQISNSHSFLLVSGLSFLLILSRGPQRCSHEGERQLLAAQTDLGLLVKVQLMGWTWGEESRMTQREPSCTVGGNANHYGEQHGGSLKKTNHSTPMSEVAQSCPTLCYPVDCSPLGSSVHGIFQARILEWVAISFSRGSSQPRDPTWVSCIPGRFFTV